MTVLLENRQCSIRVDDGLADVAQKAVYAVFERENFP